MPENNSSQELLTRLIERLDYLEYSLSQQIARIYIIEQKLSIIPPLEKRQQVDEPLPVTPPVEPAATAGIEIEAEPSPTIIQKVLPEKTGSGRDLEILIGGTWFNRVGIVAIILGVGYLFREAIRRGWIGPSGRVLIGIALGIGLVVSGERIRARGYRNYAQSLTGGGIAILYLSFYAAFARYELIGQPLAFALMSLVTLTAVSLAARNDALAVAILGLIGGFITPILLSTGHDNQAGLFTYIALLDAGVLALAYFKQWRVLNYLAFGGSVLIAALWLSEWYESRKLWPTIFFVTLLFLIFSALAILNNTIRRRPTRLLDLGLIFTNAAVYFATCYALLETDYRPYLGLFAVLMSVFYVGLGYLTFRRNREDRYLFYSFIGLAAIFLTLAAPIQFDQHWVTMFWAIEGAVLSWIGLKVEKRETRYAGIFIYFIALWHWLVIDYGEFVVAQNQSFIPIFNRRGFSAMVLVASLGVTAHLYRRFGQTINNEERDWINAACAMAANFLALILLSTDIHDYFGQSTAMTDRQRLNNTQEFALSLLWTIYGALALIVGFTRRSRVVRLFALGLLAWTFLKVVFVDTSYASASWHSLVFNQTFGAFVFLIIALACAIRFYARGEGIDEIERKVALTGLTIAINLLGLIGLSAEGYGRLESRIRSGGVTADDMPDLLLARGLSLSIIWAVYGGAMLTVGIWRSNRLLRVMALGLLVITILKVFLLDLASLDKIYRIISFIVLGAILLAVSFLYQKERIRNKGKN